MTQYYRPLSPAMWGVTVSIRCLTTSPSHGGSLFNKLLSWSYRRSVGEESCFMGNHLVPPLPPPPAHPHRAPSGSPWETSRMQKKIIKQRILLNRWQLGITIPPKPQGSKFPFCSPGVLTMEGRDLASFLFLWNLIKEVESTLIYWDFLLAFLAFLAFLASLASVASVAFPASVASLGTVLPVGWACMAWGSTFTSASGIAGGRLQRPGTAHAGAACCDSSNWPARGRAWTSWNWRLQPRSPEQTFLPGLEANNPARRLTVGLRKPPRLFPLHFCVGKEEGKRVRASTIGFWSLLTQEEPA